MHRSRAVPDLKEMPVPEAPIKDSAMARGGTSFFKLANPELMFDTKNMYSWLFVAVGWLGFGSYMWILSNEEEERYFDQQAHQNVYGPQAGASKQ